MNSFQKVSVTLWMIFMIAICGGIPIHMPSGNVYSLFGADAPNGSSHSLLVLGGQTAKMDAVCVLSLGNQVAGRDAVQLLGGISGYQVAGCQAVQTIGFVWYQQGDIRAIQALGLLGIQNGRSTFQVGLALLRSAEREHGVNLTLYRVKK